MRRSRFTAALILTFVATAFADDLESLHQFNIAVPLNRKLDLTIHSRLRTYHNASTLFQERVGPILYWRIQPRLTLISGYYFLSQDSPRNPRNDDFHRAFGGFAIPIAETSSYQIESRTLVERFADTPSGDFTRIRQRLLVTLRRQQRVNPFFSAEGLHATGKVIGRFAGGIAWQVSPWLVTGIGYEFRQSPVNPPSHIITTLVQFQKPRREP